MANLDSGTQLGQYRIGDQIGQGGMATVYSAVHIASGHEAAVKVLKLEPDTAEEFTRRLEREFKTVSALHHPNILSMYSFGKDEHGVYLIMELLTGGSLDKRKADYRDSSPEKLVELLTQIGSALDYGHQRGVIHRDLKPQNILFNTRDEAILTDFGIAKVLHETTTLTKAGMIVGTPAYMPPEQWRGELIDGRADVYALGAMVFELLAGRAPFQADSVLNLMHLHIYQPPPSLLRFRPDLPGRIDWILNKALAKHPANRFESAVALANAFRTVLKEEPGWSAQSGQSAPDTTSALVTHRANQPTFIAVSPERAAEQEQHALAAMQAETAQRVPRPAIRSINPPPLDARDRFKGRVKELADVMRLLSERARLISIYGRGGVGKTALACKVLSDWQETADESAPTGIVYLSAVSTGLSLDRILADFGRLLGGAAQESLNALRSEGQMPPAQKAVAFLDLLKDGRYAVLLDNLETLQDPESGELSDAELKALTEVVLKQGGPLTLIVTSREPLALPRELKSQERLVPLEEGLQTEDAIALLRASDPDNLAGLRDASDSKLMRIVEKTRGFPRALEAAVGLLLEDSLMDLDALLGDARDGPAADYDLTELIVKHAIDRLSPSALCAMEGLAVFGTPVKQSALEFLLAPYLDTSNLRPILNRLVRSYFVNFNRATGSFALHPIDRAYCYSRLPEGSVSDKPVPDQPPRYTRHALNYRAADFYSRQRKPQDEWKSIDDLTPQLSEFEYLCEAGDYDAAVQQLAAIEGDYLFVWGQFARLIEMHERLLNKVVDPKLIRKNILGLGQVYISIGRHADMIPLGQNALESARHESDWLDQGLLLNQLGNAAISSGQYEQAVDYFQKAIPLSQRAGNQRMEARQTSNLGTAYWYLGQIQQGIEAYKQVLPLLHRIQDRQGEAVCAANLASAYLDLGDYQASLEYSEQALQIADESHDLATQGMVLSNMSLAETRLGEYDKALSHLQKALQIAEETHDVQLQSYSGGNLTTLMLAMGNLSGAKEAGAKASKLNVPSNQHGATALYGLALFRLGEQDAARSAWIEAIRLAEIERANAPQYSKAYYVKGLALAGLALLDSSQLEPAQESYRAALQIESSGGILTDELRYLDLLGQGTDVQRLQPIRDLFKQTVQN